MTGTASAIARHRQQGISLVVVLILLVVMSMLGLAVLRSSAMQERMAANLNDRHQAFQAAETTLRSVVDNLNANASITGLQYGQTLDELGVECDPNPGCELDLPNMNPTLPAGASYTIEFMGLGKGSHLQGVCETTAGTGNFQCQRPMFRVTATGQGLSDVARVTLQANVISR